VILKSLATLGMTQVRTGSRGLVRGMTRAAYKTEGERASEETTAGFPS